VSVNQSKKPSERLVQGEQLHRWQGRHSRPTFAPDTHNTTGDFYSTHQLLGVTVISCEFLQSEEMAEKEEPREEVVNETITLKVRDQAGEEMFFKVTNQSQD
jgi:hypothetical protein